jgi:2-dehydro-3-deoxyphosphogluconate aldolase / (4S)-4-hydroxy-2-oxoglutarate aldolase
VTQYSQIAETIELMHRSPIIPVVTVAGPQDGVLLAGALVAGGLPVLEITLRTPGALAAIRAIRTALPGAIVGAGTITEPQQIEAAVEAGASFLVSPGMTERLIEGAVGCAVPFLPGIATASEAIRLMERGFRAMKFFPAEAAGGVAYLASLAGPLGELKFCPTGGITESLARTYLAQANVVCVGGSWMMPKALVAAGDYRAIEQLSRTASALQKL